MSIGTFLRKKLRTRLKPYQLQGVRFLVQAGGRALLADDMGLGKTIQMIAYLLLRKEARPVVVVCPASLKYQWQEQFLTHAGLKSEVLEGKTPYPTRSKILIINYEILQDWEDDLRARGVTVLVMDECHYVKNRSAKRTKACRRVANSCEHVVALSGTPITNAPVEFFPVLQMIRPRLFHSFTEYAWSFCAPKKGFRGSWDYSGSSNIKQLRKLIRPFMLRRLKKDHLKDLPPKRRILLPVEIPNRKEYIRARDDFMEWLATEEGIEAVQSAAGAMALVRLSKLKQITARGKLKLAMQWIENFRANSQEKLVVFAVHTEILDALQKHFPTAALVSGKVPPKKRQAEMVRFQEDPDCWLFIGQLKAAGEGLNLTAARTSLTLEFGWNEAQHNQAEDRTNRIGQKSRRGCVNYYMFARNTIDEWFLEVIHSKQVPIDKILEGGKPKDRVSLLRLLEKLGEVA